MAGLRYGKVLTGGGLLTLEYALEPVRVMNLARRGRETGALAIGASPLGFAVHVPSNGRFQMSLSAGAGFLLSTRDIPSDLSRRFNFTYDFGAALELVGSSRWGVALGYRYHHLSNAGTALENPGLTGDILYMAVTFP